MIKFVCNKKMQENSLSVAVTDTEPVFVEEKVMNYSVWIPMGLRQDHNHKV